MISAQPTDPDPILLKRCLNLEKEPDPGVWEKMAVCLIFGQIFTVMLISCPRHYFMTDPIKQLKPACLSLYPGCLPAGRTRQKSAGEHML